MYLLWVHNRRHGVFCCHTKDQNARLSNIFSKTVMENSQKYLQWSFSGSFIISFLVQWDEIGNTSRLFPTDFEINSGVMNKSLKNKIKKFVEIPFDDILETDRCKPDCKYKLNIISFSILQLDIHNFVDQVYPLALVLC